MTFLLTFALATALTATQSAPYQLNDSVKQLLTAGDNVTALSTARDAVASAEALLGSNHPATAMIIRNLALAYLANGDTAHAEAAARRSLAILETRFSTTDASLVPVLNVLTETYVAEGRLERARLTAKRAVEIGPEAGLHYATALRNIGAVLEIQSRGNGSAKQYDRAATSSHPVQ